MKAWLVLGMVLGVMAIASCGDDGAAATPDGATGNIDGGTTYRTLVELPYTIPAGGESFLCARITATENFSMGALRVEVPLGTFRLVVGHGGAGPDGVAACASQVPGVATLGGTPIAAFGIGSGVTDLVFPDGVGITVTAGEKFVLYAHLINTTGSDVTETARVLALPRGPGAAATTFPASLGDYTAPTGPSTTTEEYQASSNLRVVSIQPHLNFSGIRATVEHVHGGTTDVLLDTAFTIIDQKPTMLDLQVAPGDTLRLICDYQNDSGAPEAELCHLITIADVVN